MSAVASFDQAVFLLAEAGMRFGTPSSVGGGASAGAKRPAASLDSEAPPSSSSSGECGPPGPPGLPGVLLLPRQRQLRLEDVLGGPKRARREPPPSSTPAEVPAEDLQFLEQCGADLFSS
jgi:hypothetical protein